MDDYRVADEAFFQQDRYKHVNRSKMYDNDHENKSHKSKNSKHSTQSRKLNKKKRQKKRLTSKQERYPSAMQEQNPDDSPSDSDETIDSSTSKSEPNRPHGTHLNRSGIPFETKRYKTGHRRLFNEVYLRKNMTLQFDSKDNFLEQYESFRIFMARGGVYLKFIYNIAKDDPIYVVKTYLTSSDYKAQSQSAYNIIGFVRIFLFLSRH